MGVNWGLINFASPFSFVQMRICLWLCILIAELSSISLMDWLIDIFGFIICVHRIQVLLRSETTALVQCICSACHAVFAVSRLHQIYVYFDFLNSQCVQWVTDVAILFPPFFQSCHLWWSRIFFALVSTGKCHVCVHVMERQFTGFSVHR